MELGNRLKSARTDKNLSMYQLAKRINMSQSTISKIESGKMRPTVDLMERICEALNLTLAEFFAEDQDELEPDLRRLVEAAKRLTPDQRKALQAFLDSLEGR
ncbi:helix-turn-helix domain-containing protein [Alicyclobacillus acidoterrestris]|uniref:helix-turn-helix domain-containing protein n=1 Tax=Alicyclobacillus TaxID=29330 RepID=UPI001F1B85DF|nr:helix-turn-helix transcriptional regulator [Alicyclobacillus suci]